MLSSSSHKSVFNPYQLSPSLSPQMIPQFISEQDYTSAVLVGLKLNLNIRKLIKKIPVQFASSVIGELEPQYAELLLEKICEEGKASLKELIWIDSALRQGHKPSATLRAALENL